MCAFWTVKNECISLFSAIHSLRDERYARIIRYLEKNYLLLEADVMNSTYHFALRYSVTIQVVDCKYKRGRANTDRGFHGSVVVPGERLPI